MMARPQVIESHDGQNETSGGRNETAANELTISPGGVPSSSVVPKTTPVGHRPKDARRPRSSMHDSPGWDGMDVRHGLSCRACSRPSAASPHAIAGAGEDDVRSEGAAEDVPVRLPTIVAVLGVVPPPPPTGRHC